MKAALNIISTFWHLPARCSLVYAVGCSHTSDQGWDASIVTVGHARYAWTGPTQSEAMEATMKAFRGAGK